MDEEIKRQQEAEAKEKERVAKLEADLAEKNKELEGLKGKDMNFSKVREAAETAEKKANEVAKQLEEERQGRINDRKDIVIGAIVGKDSELKKVVEYHYSKFSGEAKTPEEIEARVKESYILATKGQSNPIKKQVGAGNGGIVNNSGSGAGEIDPEVKTWAGEFNKYGAGITDEALSKKAKK